MDAKTKERIAEFICGDGEKYPIYRSSMYLNKFFQEIGIAATHDGSTRKWWVLSVINNLNGPDLQKVILRLVSPKLYGGDRDKIKLALKTMNEILAVESLKVFFEGIEPRLTRENPNYNFAEPDEERELKPLPPPDFDKLNFEYGISELLKKRWDEIQVCMDSNATLSAVILMGSMLEGFLFGIMQRRPQLANTAASTPKTKEGKPKHFAEWSLSEMIDVAHDIGWIQLDVKRFSHALRSFRNIIHPYEQLATKANPDLDTCKISWLVVQAACNDMAKWLEANK